MMRAAIACMPSYKQIYTKHKPVGDQTRRAKQFMQETSSS